MNKNRWRGPWKKIILLFLVTVILTFTFNWNIIYDWFGDEKDSKENLHCFELPGSKLPELDEQEPNLGSAIYFHETSCPKHNLDITLNARQSCSVESALRAHSNTDVFLLISTPVLTPLKETENILIRQLLTYPNFKIRHITMSKYLSTTPLKQLYESGVLNYSLWPVQHSSDVLRFATLYKFGGIYLDLDVIVLKPLTNFRNIAGAESNVSLGSGILAFGSDRAGREVARQCVLELASTYDPRQWGFNGPGVITRVMERRCKTNLISQMIKSFCGGFKVYPVDYFQAISFQESQLLFEEGNTEKVLKLVNGSYTIHYWNKMSSNYVLENGLNIPFIIYARKYCPKVVIWEGSICKPVQSTKKLQNEGLDDSYLRINLKLF